MISSSEINVNRKSQQRDFVLWLFEWLKSERQCEEIHKT
jgi:hypothetical protein